MPHHRHPSLTFDLPLSIPTFGPRVGRVALIRDSFRDSFPGRTVADPCDAVTGTAGGTGACMAATATTATTTITIDTPNVLVGTARGVVPHLSRDHANGSDAIRWINVPFESFLEQVPPIPTLQNGPHPLHRFLGFDEDRHIVSLCLRDPLDTREMPPNGNMYVSANCVRGVKKVTLSEWRQYVYKTQPDIVIALSDTPFTPPPFSQKRITKSIERSAAWLADILRPLPSGGDGGGDDTGRTEPHTSRLSQHPLNVLLHMAGGTTLPAREAFACGLLETLHGAEAEAVKPLRSLDEGISGYVFDLAVLRGVQPSPNTSQHQTMRDGFLQWERPDMRQHPESIGEVLTPRTETTASSTFLSIPESRVPPPDTVSLLKASLGQLPERKLRLVTGVRSPHEMLRLVRDVGIDLFGVEWAVHAAGVGVALDFVFPAPTSGEDDGKCTAPRQSLGHNLYDPIYARQFGRLADTLAGAGERGDGVVTARWDVCLCIACSPRTPSSHILHSALDGQSYTMTGGETGQTREGGEYGKPYSRAYLHHLLRTHEMSAHTFLVGHNLAIVSAFLAGVRRVWVESGGERFALEVERFEHAYNEDRELFVAAKNDWQCVDMARGKGRFAREKEKQGRDQDG